MAMHPTFAHAAADLRRHAYLVESDAAWQSRPEHERSRVRPRRHALQRLLDSVALFMSRVVDDFEGSAGSPRMAPRRHSPRLPLAQRFRWQRSWGP
jgi:hypothetical protein